MAWSDGLTIEDAPIQATQIAVRRPVTTTPAATATTTSPTLATPSPTTTTDVSGSPGGPRTGTPAAKGPVANTFADWLTKFYADNGLTGSDGGPAPTAADIAYWQNVDPSGIAAGNYNFVASKILPSGQQAVMPGPPGSRPQTGPTPGGPTGTAGGPGSGAFSYPSWNQQFTYAPWTQTFTPPTGLTEQNDPGYQERLQLGDQGLLNQGAAQGTLLTTGTLKDISAYNQTFASNEYSNVYGRALTDYQTALQAYQQNYNTAAQQYNQSYQQYLNGYNQAYQSYMGNFGVSNTLNQEGFQNYLSLADLGLSGASGTNAAAGAFGTNSANNAYNAGNANAAGTVASANAQNTGLANVTNTALPYLGYNGTPYYGTQSSYTGLNSFQNPSTSGFQNGYGLPGYSSYPTM